METNRKSKAKINSLNEKINVLKDMQRGAPLDIYYELIALEEDLSYLDKSDKNYKKTVEQADKLSEEYRKWRYSKKELYSEIKKNLYPKVKCRSDKQNILHGSNSLKYQSVLNRKTRLYPINIENCNLGTFTALNPSHDFTLQFKCFRADTVWGITESNDVHCGIIGVCNKHYDSNISNINGKGKKLGEMKFIWEATVPEDDIYFMNPLQQVLISGTCSTQGTRKIYGVDAIASVEVFYLICLDYTPIIFENISILEIESRRNYDDKNKNFNENLIIPNELYIEAKKGQELMMEISLTASTWTRGEADAEVDLDMFGLFCNVRKDLDIPVKA